MNYQELAKLVDGRKDNRACLKRSHMQVWAERRSPSTIAIRLAETDILLFDDCGGVKIDSGGHKTQTTKRRLNDYLPPGWSVSQSDFVWYLTNRQAGESQLFLDGTIIQSDGQVLLPYSPPTAEEMTEERRQVDEYIRLYVEDLLHGLIPAPSGADCWMCLLANNKDAGHILQHIEEGYFPGALLQSAMDENNHKLSGVAIDHLRHVWITGGGTPNRLIFGEALRGEFRRILDSYIKDRLGLPRGGAR